MSTGKTREWALYGGAGFIGQHLAYSILENNPDHRVTLLDIQSPGASAWKAPLDRFLADGRLSVVKADVRDIDDLARHRGPFDVIVNLAAIHREPGHKANEYFETNVSGARNVCHLAELVGCTEIIFTSSISVYGLHDQSVDEHTRPKPITPYGQSKLAAERIHIDWAEKTEGRLSIIRPGVVFGPGENGNVSRLVRETLRLGRPISIKPDQPKAGIYIEELLEVIHWLRNQALPAGGHHLVNGVSDENLTFNAYGHVLQELKQLDKPPLVVSEPILRIATSMMKPLGLILPSGSKIHPERLAKLTRPNDEKPAVLVSKNYPFKWTLKSSLADWLDKGL